MGGGGWAVAVAVAEGRQRGRNNDQVRAPIDAQCMRVKRGIPMVQPAGSSTKIS